MDEPLTDLDYCQTTDGIIYIVCGCYHPPGQVLALPVYWPDPTGDRYEPKLGTYHKKIDTFSRAVFAEHPDYRNPHSPWLIPLIPRTEIKRIFHPRDRIATFLVEHKTDIWRRIFDGLVTICSVPATDIGIFGSYLTGLHQNQAGEHQKDIDFAVYGLANLARVKNNFSQLRQAVGAGPISAEHIAYQTKKYGAELISPATTWEKLLAGKWSSLQIGPGLLSTIRFVYKTAEIPPDLLRNPVDQGPITVSGLVIDDLGTNFMPRQFSLKTKTGTYQVLSYFWAYQSAVKIGQTVEVSGTICNNHFVCLNLPTSSLKILS